MPRRADTRTLIGGGGCIFMFCPTDFFSNIIFFSLLDSDWLKSVPINP